MLARRFSVSQKNKQLFLEDGEKCLVKLPELMASLRVKLEDLNRNAEGTARGGRAVHCGEGFVIWFWTLVNISWTLNEFYRFCLAAEPYLQVSSCGTSKTKASQGGLLRVGTSKNTGARSSAPWLAFVLEVPLCDVCLSMCTFISCDWIMQRAHCYQPPSCLFCLTNSICSFTFLRTIYWQTVFELSVLDCRARN